MRLIRGVEGRVVKGETRNGRKVDEERDLERGEVVAILKGLKERKAVEKNDIPNEVWKYGGKKIERSGCGNSAIGFGKGRVGRRNGRRG